MNLVYKYIIFINMNLQENIQRIKEMMGLITEQGTTPTAINLSISGNYTASNCDELHAFQGTGGKTIGDMNGIVANKIKEWNKQNINVKPESVTVKVNGMNVSWTVDFVESDVNYNGFTSRGAGCNNDIEKRAGNDSINNGKQSVVDNLLKKGTNVIKIEEFDSFTYNGGGNSFKQVFYRYITETKDNQVNVKSHEVSGASLEELRKNLRDYTMGKNLNIDKNSIKIDVDNYTVTFTDGDTPIKSISLIFDPDKTVLNDRWETIKKDKEPTIEQIKNDKKGDLFWKLSIIKM